MVNKGKQPIKKKAPPKRERTLDDACRSSLDSSAAVQSCSEWLLQRRSHPTCRNPAYEDPAYQSSTATGASGSVNGPPTADQTDSSSESHSSIQSTSAAVPLCSSQLANHSEHESNRPDTDTSSGQTAAVSYQPTAATSMSHSEWLAASYSRSVTLPVTSAAQLRYRRRRSVMSLLRSMQKFLTSRLRRQPIRGQTTPQFESRPASSTAPNHSSQPSASSSAMQEASDERALCGVSDELARRGVFVVPVMNMGSGDRPAGGRGPEKSHELKHVRAHTTVDYHHYLVPDLTAVTSCGFYWGVMDRYEAESLLDDKPEGTFLLRDSSQDDFIFSVSFRRYGRSLHARIEQWNHMFSFDAHESAAFKSKSVKGLIEHYKDPHTCMFFEPMLTRPLNRPKAFSLQHMARAVVCDHISYDMIDSLTIPRNLQDYLRYYHYKQKIRVRTHSTSRDIHAAST